MSCSKKEWVFNIATTTLSQAEGRSVQSATNATSTQTPHSAVCPACNHLPLHQNCYPLLHPSQLSSQGRKQRQDKPDLGQVMSGKFNTAASKEGDLSKEDDRYLSDDGDINLADDGGEIESEGEGEGEDEGKDEDESKGKGKEGESTNDDVLAEWMTWLPSAQGDES